MQLTDKQKGRRAMLIALTILLVAIALGATGQIFLKKGVTEVKHDYADAQGVAMATVEDKVPASYILKSFITKPLILIGFFCYGVSSMFYLVSLSRLDLSYAYPLIALSYVIVAVLSWQLLGESLPPLRLVGLAVVLVGVAILGASYTRVPAELPVPPIVDSSAGGGEELAR